MSDDLIDLGNAPEIYADEVGSAECTGQVFRTNYVAWKRMPGSAIYSRVVVATIVRPTGSYRAGVVGKFLAAANRVLVTPCH